MIYKKSVPHFFKSFFTDAVANKIMNISIKSYSAIKRDSPQITNTLYKTFLISDFFISHSKTSFFLSFNDKTELFKLSSSFFNRVLDPIIKVRCNKANKNDIYFVEKTTFMNTISGVQGSALSCYHESMKVAISLCRFINCTTTCSGNSFQRKGDVSGGACFFSVSEASIKSCYFEACVGSALGSAVYVSTPINHYFNASCVSDYNCGNTITSYHSVYAFETSTSNIRNINSTKPFSRNFHGVVLFGQYPRKFSVMYSSIIFRTGETNAVPFLLSESDDADISCLDHIYIRNGKSSDGLFTIYKGTYVLKDVVFDSCSGKLYYTPVTTFKSITFENTVFSSEIDLLSATTDASCSKGRKETNLIINCRFDFKVRFCSCFKRRSTSCSVLSVLILLDI